MGMIFVVVSLSFPKNKNKKNFLALVVTATSQHKPLWDTSNVDCIDAQWRIFLDQNDIQGIFGMLQNLLLFAFLNVLVPLDRNL